MTLAIHVEEEEWFARFSSFVHLIRVIARIRRFIAGCRRQTPPLSHLSRDELDHTALAVKHVHLNITRFANHMTNSHENVLSLCDP